MTASPDVPDRGGGGDIRNTAGLLGFGVDVVKELQEEVALMELVV